MSLAALDTYLTPLKRYFAQEGVSEISINRPKELWVEVYGDMYRDEIPEFDLDHLKALARLVAQSTSQKVSEESPCSRPRCRKAIVFRWCSRLPAKSARLPCPSANRPSSILIWTNTKLLAHFRPPPCATKKTNSMRNCANCLMPAPSRSLSKSGARQKEHHR